MCLWPRQRSSSAVPCAPEADAQGFSRVRQPGKIWPSGKIETQDPQESANIGLDLPKVGPFESVTGA